MTKNTELKSNDSKETHPNERTRKLKFESGSEEKPDNEVNTEQNSIKSVLGTLRKQFVAAAIFSGMINILMLSGSIFMLQVYDRVLPSHSISTLVALVILVVLMYVMSTLLETIRSRLFARIGRQLDISLRDAVFELNVKSFLPGRPPETNAAFKDLEQLRGFLASGAPSALFDLPWMPLYSILLFVLHPFIGFLGIAGIVALAFITWLNDKIASPHQQASSNLSHQANSFVDMVRFNSETIVPLGMTAPMKAEWLRLNQSSGDAIIIASDKTGLFGGLSRFLRMALQSLVLALGAYLAIIGEATGGIMIASSIILGKALAPVELAISHWRGFVLARQSNYRLEGCLKTKEFAPKSELPLPNAKIVVENLYLTAPEHNLPILSNLNFDAVAGDAIGIIGPSGCGKSTLIRAIVGLWPIAKGTVSFDGSTLDQWHENKIGEFLGYVPQSIELFSGSVSENISRFNQNAKTEDVIAAANLAGIDPFIRSLEGGYDASVGPRGNKLSAGQRQRIALARAFYGNPFLVILDEPNSALDNDGVTALIMAIARIRERGGIALIVAHRPDVLKVVNKVLVLGGGQQQAFGPRDDVLKKVLTPMPNQTKA